MPGPWEKYEPSSSGPWGKYQKKSIDTTEEESSFKRGIGLLNLGIARGATFGTATDPLSAGMRALGIEVAERPPETIGEHTIEGIGMAAGALPGTLLAGKQLALRAGGSILSRLGQTILGPFYRAPIYATATELAAGAGAGSGKGTVEKAGRPELTPFAEIIGGLVGGIGVGIPLEARRLFFQTAQNILRQSRSRLSQTFFPFTKAGAEPRASAQLRQRVADPKAAAALVKQGSIGELSPAQRIGDDNLIALERVIMERNPESARSYRLQIERSENALRDAATEMADVSGMERRIELARERADTKLAFIEPTRRAEQASIAYHDELLSSLKSAKEAERKLWDIPNIRVATANLKQRFANLEAELPKAQSDDMPVKARQLLSKRKPSDAEDALILGPRGETLITKEGAIGSSVFRESEPVKEVHGFFSQMREDARAARAAGSWNKARIADDLAEAAWLDLTGAAENQTAVGAQLQAAREYSRNLNQTFRQGDVGKILGYVQTGERRVQPPEALEVVLGGRGGAQAAVTAKELMQAANFGGRDPAMAETAIHDYIKRRFLLAAHFDPEQTGVFSLNGARSFLRNNEQLLGQYPGLQKTMTDALESMMSASKLQSLRTTISKALQSQTPKESLQRALRGLTPQDRLAARAGLLEYGLYSGGRQALDETGQPAIVGARLQGMLINPKMKAAFTELFDPPSIERLSRISNELTKLQKAAGSIDPTIPGGEFIEPREMSKIVKGLNYLVGTVGARIGAWFGGQTSGASLRTASRLAKMSESGMVNYMNRYSIKLIQDAANDPKLYSALLTRLDAPEAASEASFQTLMGWMKKTAVTSAQQVLGPTAIGTTGVVVPSLIGPPPSVP